MASRKYCKYCDRKVMAQWSWAQPHPALILLTVMTCGLFFPFACLINSKNAGYVCPKCDSFV